MNEPPVFPELPDYLVRDLGVLDLVLRQGCRKYLEHGDPLPPDVVTLLCERFLSYSDTLAKFATKPRGNPGKTSGRWVAVLVALGWKVEAAVAHVAEQLGQDPKTVDRNYWRWLKRSKKSE